jgi:hypothetical protein
MRQQRLGRHAAVNRPVRRGSLNDRALTSPAAVPWPADHLHPQLRRHVIQHLRTVLADDMHRAAATRARFVLDIDDQLNPRQMRGQRAAVALRRFGGTRSGGGRLWF